MSFKPWFCHLIKKKKEIIERPHFPCLHFNTSKSPNLSSTILLCAHQYLLATLVVSIFDDHRYICINFGQFPLIKSCFFLSCIHICCLFYSVVTLPFWSCRTLESNRIDLLFVKILSSSEELAILGLWVLSSEKVMQFDTGNWGFCLLELHWIGNFLLLDLIFEEVNGDFVILVSVSLVIYVNSW